MLPGTARQYHQSEGPEIRRPKAEARRKAENRNPKQPFPRPVADLPTRRAIRASGSGFLSGFGLRTSGLAGSRRVVVFRCATPASPLIFGPPHAKTRCQTPIGHLSLAMGDAPNRKPPRPSNSRPDLISLPDTTGQSLPEAGTWLLRGYDVSRTCLVQGGSGQTQQIGLFLTFPTPPPATTISSPNVSRLPAP